MACCPGSLLPVVMLECGQRARAPRVCFRLRVCECYVCVCPTYVPTTPLCLSESSSIRTRILRSFSSSVSFGSDSAEIEKGMKGRNKRKKRQRGRGGSCGVKGRANVYRLCKTERGSGGSSPIDPMVRSLAAHFYVININYDYT